MVNFKTIRSASEASSVGEELVSQLGVSTTIFQMANMVRLYDDGSGTGAYIDYTKVNEYEKRRVTTEMIALETTLKERGLSVTQVVTSGFDAAYEIIELCRKMGIDLVVMSTYGRSGITRWVLGNVAEEVLRHGVIPLLLVHARAG